MFPFFSKFKDMLAVMSLRNDGNMKVYRSAGPYTETDNNWTEGITHNKVNGKQIGHAAFKQNEIIDKKAVASRGWFLSGLGIEHDHVVSVKSVHANNIEIVSGFDGGKFIDNTDGLISAGSPGLFLCITVADCIPVVIFEPKRKVMCLLHCGWKGLVKGIIYNAVSIIKDSFSGGGDIISDSLYAGIGPGIGVCHFEVEKDILPVFSKYEDAILRTNTKDIPESYNKGINTRSEFLKTVNKCRTDKERYFIDLKQVAKKQLQDCQVNPANIEINPDCTYCKSDIFFSFRKDKKRPVDAMMVIAGWLN